MGDIILVAWDVEKSPHLQTLVPDECEGRVLGIRDHQVTAFFVHGPGFDPEEETVVLDLDQGVDLSDRGVLRSIRVKGRHGDEPK